MNTLYLMCGAPFSGKTTLAKHITNATNADYISLDDIMRQRGLDVSQTQPIEEWEKTHHICFQQLRSLMHNHTDIVLDDTNYLKWLRDRFRRVATEYTYQVVTIYLAIPLTELERRRQQVRITGERNNLVDESFYPLIENFEIPDEQENMLIFHSTADPLVWIQDHILADRKG